MIYAEAIMMELASVFGRQRAHNLVDKAVSLALNGMSFKHALQEIPDIRDTISQNTFKEIFSGKIHREMGKEISLKMISFVKLHK